DYRRADSTWRNISDKYLQTWRRLILHLRIPWLENNVFGNLILAGVRFAGVDGIKAFAAMIGQSKGGEALKKMLAMPVTKNALTDEDIRELPPEQARPCTFFGSTLPPTGISKRRSVRAAQKAGAATLGLLPKADVATEIQIRRWALNTVLRGSDEVKAIYKAMPRQTRSWRDASRQALEENPQLVEQVSRDVNDAL